jgi:hypothetical protein
MNSRTLLALAVLLVSLSLLAQQPGSAQKPDSAQEQLAPTTSAQPPASAEPRDLEEWLNTENAQERVARLESLGIDKKTVEDFTFQGLKDFAPQDQKYVEVKPFRTETRQGSVVLFLPCVLDDAYLYALVREANSWRVTDWERFDCHYDMSVSVEIAPIRNPAFDEVLMHHVGEGHAGSYSQQDFEVYTIAKGKLKRVLDAEEVIVAAQYVGPNVAMNEITQRSFFVLVPIENSRSRVIEETQSYQINNKLTVKRRQFRWNAAKGRYLPSKFIHVEAAPN